MKRIWSGENYFLKTPTKHELLLADFCGVGGDGITFGCVRNRGLYGRHKTRLRFCAGEFRVIDDLRFPDRCFFRFLD